MWDLSPYEGIEIVVQRGGSDERSSSSVSCAVELANGFD